MLTTPLKMLIVGVALQILLVIASALYIPGTTLSFNSIFFHGGDTTAQVGRIILSPQLGADENIEGLVYCSRGYHIGDDKSCGPCELMATIQRVINYAIFLSVVLATIMFTYAGVLYVSASRNPGNIAKAKEIFWNVLFGMVAILAAWLIINTVLNVLTKRDLFATSRILCETELRGANYLPDPSQGAAFNMPEINGITSEIAANEARIARWKQELAECIKPGSLSSTASCNRLKEDIALFEAKNEQLKQDLTNAQIAAEANSATGLSPVATVIPAGIDPLDGRDPNAYIPHADVSGANLALVDKNTQVYRDTIVAELARQGVTNITPEFVQAIMSAESAGNPNATSPAGAVGLMQVLPSTARQYLPGMTDAQIRQALLNPQTSIEVGIKVLNASAKNSNVENQNDLIASYNSGAGNVANAAGRKPALAPSSDCPGYNAYECSINPGGLKETRDYVARVNYYNNYYSNK